MYAKLIPLTLPCVCCVCRVCRVCAMCAHQVPLDQILTTQRDVLALQHVIQRELTAAHGRLQTVATGASQASQPPPLLPPDWSTGGWQDQRGTLWAELQVTWGPAWLSHIWCYE